MKGFLHNLISIYSRAYYELCPILIFYAVMTWYGILCCILPVVLYGLVWSGKEWQCMVLCALDVGVCPCWGCRCPLSGPGPGIPSHTPNTQPQRAETRPILVLNFHFLLKKLWSVSIKSLTISGNFVSIKLSVFLSMCCMLFSMCDRATREGSPARYRRPAAWCNMGQRGSPVIS